MACMFFTSSKEAIQSKTLTNVPLPATFESLSLKVGTLI